MTPFKKNHNHRNHHNHHHHHKRNTISKHRSKKSGLFEGLVTSDGSDWSHPHPHPHPHPGPGPDLDHIFKHYGIILMFFMCLAIPAYQLLCHITSFAILCINKGRFHVFHRFHGFLKAITNGVQMLGLFSILLIQFLYFEDNVFFHTFWFPVMSLCVCIVAFNLNVVFLYQVRKGAVSVSG